MLNLSRNLGLITGASVMGAVFALASATTDITTARPDAVAAGMRVTFAVAAIWSSPRSPRVQPIATLSAGGKCFRQQSEY